MKATLEENIAFGVDSYTPEQLVKAAKDANAYDFIMDKHKFPKGFQTKITEGGKNLSGGQKQRIAIARALMKNPKILILDEATSSLDTKSEREVKDAIDQIIDKYTLTVVVIAHRLSTIMDADKIVMLEKGKIAESGTHHQLRKKIGGHYRKLVLAQLVEELPTEKDGKKGDGKDGDSGDDSEPDKQPGDGDGSDSDESSEPD